MAKRRHLVEATNLGCDPDWTSRNTPSQRSDMDSQAQQLERQRRQIEAPKRPPLYEMGKEGHFGTFLATDVKLRYPFACHFAHYTLIKDTTCVESG